jgi:hypothetical protein
VKKILLFITFLFLASCSSSDRQNVSGAKDESSAVNVLLTIRSPSGNGIAKIAATEWNRLITVISGIGMDTVFDTIVLSGSETYKQFTIGSIPAGTQRKVRSWTENSLSGKTIHAPAETTLTMNPGVTENISLLLLPCAGTIQFQFADIATNIDSIFCQFATVSDTFKAVAKRSDRGVSVSLDYIPNGVSGLLSIYGTKFTVDHRDTIYRFERSLVFNASADSVLYPVFRKSGSIAKIEVTAIRPGVTIVQGSMNSNGDSAELGPIFISEVLVKNGYEFIEICNPTGDSLYYDSLYLTVNSSDKLLLRCVGLPANGFYVAGRFLLPGVDTVMTAIDLLSTGEENLVLKNSNKQIVDMIYISKILTVNSDKSIELQLPSGVFQNNFDHNWIHATEIIEGYSLYGTPGR